jgi:Zn-dependent protease
LNPIRHIDPFGSVLLPLMMYFFSGGRIIFGAAKPTPVDLRNTPNPRLANLVVSAAGPASNFLLSAAGVLLLNDRARRRRTRSATSGSRSRAELRTGALAPVTYVLFQFAIVNVGSPSST